MTKPSTRVKMNGKPVHEVQAKSVINLQSGFASKLLCDGPTFSTGSACAYSCSFCYVPDMMRKSTHHIEGAKHEDVVIRRANALEVLRRQLTHLNGKLKFPDPADRRVIYSSPLVDVAANMDLVRETIEACRLILTLTHWQIRLLSKSNLLPYIAEALGDYRDRMIYGVSTGTLDDQLARVFEGGTPLVSKRLASLRSLQDGGFRTFGMICPSLPLADNSYLAFANECAEAIRIDRCEHVWGEVINVRGESMTRTVDALRSAGFNAYADRLKEVSTDGEMWESYARTTFLAHVAASMSYPGKLRFLQYVTVKTRSWWEARREFGVVLL